MVRISKILIVLAVVLLMGEAAYAAPADIRPSFNWSGVYVGGFAGYSWVDLDYSEPDFPGFERSPNIHGMVGGAFLGYNHGFGSFVLGIEADGGWGDLDEGPDARALNYYSAFEIDWNAHIRARFGFLSGSTLLYVAGGLALAEVNVDDVDPGFGEDEARHVGWTVGVGVEHAMTKNLRARVEYLYDDYGSEDYAFTAFVPVLNYRANVDLTANTIRVGLAYQF